MQVHSSCGGLCRLVLQENGVEGKVGLGRSTRPQGGVWQTVLRIWETALTSLYQLICTVRISLESNEQSGVKGNRLLPRPDHKLELLHLG